MARYNVANNRTNILMTVRASPAIGLMADESTDISVTKELILYARVLCRGDVRVFFLKIINIADGCAGTIENAILTYLEQADIPISRISSFGSDRAAVMVGAVSGVTTWLHCFANILIFRFFSALYAAHGVRRG